jgi:hypothetical protein
MKRVLRDTAPFSSIKLLAQVQVQTEEKSNEITAIPALLGALDISGCIRGAVKGQ